MRDPCILIISAVDFFSSILVMLWLIKSLPKVYYGFGIMML